jgi:hypothetical protein
MEEVQVPRSPTIPLSPVILNELVEKKEIAPKPLKKIRVLPWLIFFFMLFLACVMGYLVYIKWHTAEIAPDVYVEAGSTDLTLTIPTPVEKVIEVVEKEILFEEAPYRNEQARFQIEIPRGWEVDDTGGAGPIVVIVDPVATLASGSALLSIISVSMDAISEETFGEFISSARDGLKQIFKSYVIEEDKSMIVNERVFRILGGSYFVHGVKMRNRNALLYHEGRAYAISATAPEPVWIKKEMVLNASIFSFMNY